jgi:hypothetical protein
MMQPPAPSAGIPPPPTSTVFQPLVNLFYIFVGYLLHRLFNFCCVIVSFLSLVGTICAFCSSFSTHSYHLFCLQCGSVRVLLPGAHDAAHLPHVGLRSNTPLLRQVSDPSQEDNLPAVPGDVEKSAANWTLR